VEKSRDIPVFTFTILHPDALRSFALTMRFTKAFSIIAAYAMLVMSNAAAVPAHDNLSGKSVAVKDTVLDSSIAFAVALARLDVVKADTAKVVHARDVTPTVASNIHLKKSESSSLASEIAALIAELEPLGEEAALRRRSTDTITSEELTLSSDISALISGLAKRAVPDRASAPIPKIDGFPTSV